MQKYFVGYLGVSMPVGLVHLFNIGPLLYTMYNIVYKSGPILAFVLVFFWLRVLDKAVCSASESTLNSSAYRIVSLMAFLATLLAVFGIR